MTEPKKPFGGPQPGSGRPSLPEGQHKRRIVLYVNPTLAAHLEAEELPQEDRRRVATRRKREAGELLATAEIQSRIV